MARKKKTTARPLHRMEHRSKSSVPITPRQREVLRLVALGHTNREIAGSLDISVRTVEVHRFNLMRRLDVRNVAQLLRQALQHNLLPRNFGNK
ncbi:MAG: response regulator transcription factor [Nitrospira sp.]|nr:response regulator transcription factor [Nitrospira sp.]